MHPSVLADGEDQHADHQGKQRNGQLPVDQEQEDKGTNDLDQGNEQVLRAVVGEFRDVKEVRDQLAHHLAGVVLIIVREGQLLIVVEEAGAHVPFHVGAHHVSLVADIIFAQTLEHIHDEKPEADKRQGMEDGFPVPGKQAVDGSPQELGVEKIYHAYEGGAEKIQEKYGFIRLIIINKFS